MYGRNIDLVEIKSGNDYKKHTALNNVLNVSDWKFGTSYVFCKDNIQSENNIVYLPWYMIMFLKAPQIPEHIKVEIDLSGLE